MTAAMLCCWYGGGFVTTWSDGGGCASAALPVEVLCEEKVLCEEELPGLSNWCRLWDEGAAVVGVVGVTRHVCLLVAGRLSCCRLVALEGEGACGVCGSHCAHAGGVSVDGEGGITEGAEVVGWVVVWGGVG